MTLGAYDESGMITWGGNWAEIITYLPHIKITFYYRTFKKCGNFLKNAHTFKK